MKKNIFFTILASLLFTGNFIFAANSLKVTIVKATYGIPSAPLDVTTVLQNAVDANNGTYYFSDATKGSAASWQTAIFGDPAVDSLKTLVVEYKIGSEDRKQSVQEHQILDIEKAGKIPLKIIKATWGALASWKDVTNTLQSDLETQAQITPRTYYVSNENYGIKEDGLWNARKLHGWQVKMFGLWLWGTKKKLKIDYTDFGVLKHVEINEGQPLYLEATTSLRALKIASAKWGAKISDLENYWKDVTEVLRKNLKDQRENTPGVFSISNTTYGTAKDGAFSGWQPKMFGLYFGGTEKTLKIKYEDYDTAKETEVKEGEPLAIGSVTLQTDPLILLEEFYAYTPGSLTMTAEIRGPSDVCIAFVPEDKKLTTGNMYVLVIGGKNNTKAWIQDGIEDNSKILGEETGCALGGRSKKKEDYAKEWNKIWITVEDNKRITFGRGINPRDEKNIIKTWEVSEPLKNPITYVAFGGKVGFPEFRNIIISEGLKEISEKRAKKEISATETKEKEISEKEISEKEISEKEAKEKEKPTANLKLDKHRVLPKKEAVK